MAGIGSGRVLAVDDDDEILAWLKVKVPPRGLDVTRCRSGSEALALLGVEPVDVVLTDLGMKEMDGIELCDRIVSNFPNIPVLLLTAHGTVAAAVAAMRVGAFDFIVKPLEIDPLVFALERAVRTRRLREEVGRLRQQVEREGWGGELWGSSLAMKEVFGFIDQVADLTTSVLITGESGTGKELVARALHRRGRRRDAPFVAVNCAALPEALLEGELFGHARGAFTGAGNARQGLFVSASGGTLFLDEIAELPVALQPKLLRALQERSVRPLGADREIPFDARVVAATNRDLDRTVADGRFRADLFFRLNVLPIWLPPLRARGSDVLVLAQRFLERFAAEMEKEVKGISPAAADRLLGYVWPGNVRELQNAIERAVALTHQEQLTVEDLPERVRSYRKAEAPPARVELPQLERLAEVERRHILRVLEAVNGNKTDASQILHIGRKTLYRKLQGYGLIERGEVTPDELEGEHLRDEREPGDGVA